jgi:hypothetical protein
MGLTLAIDPVARMSSPKGPKVVVREFAGKGVYVGQHARFAGQAFFRKAPRVRLGRWPVACPGGRSWRSAKQPNVEPDRIPFTRPIFRLLPSGNNPFFYPLSWEWEGFLGKALFACGQPPRVAGRLRIRVFARPHDKFL